MEEKNRGPLSSVLYGGGGLTTDIKNALLQLASKVAYIDENGETYYNDLYDALNHVTRYSITNTLTGCTSSNSASTAIEGESYAANITASNGYTLVGATVSVTMGGNDITGTAYSNGTISIANVSGDIVISVSAVVLALTSISAVYTQSGKVFSSDSLDSLKSDLVVTAHYNDASTVTIQDNDYTLSGTLTKNTTSTITVTYSTQTTTIDVVVTNSALISSTPITFIKSGNSNASWDSSTHTGTITSSGSGYPGMMLQGLLYKWSQVSNSVIKAEFDCTLSGYSSGDGGIFAPGLYTSANPSDNAASRPYSSTLKTVKTNGTTHYSVTMDLSKKTTWTGDNNYLGLGVLLNANSRCSISFSNMSIEVSL